jgi:cardiolipin synthase
MPLMRSLHQGRFRRHFRRGTRAAAAFGNQVTFYPHGGLLFQSLFGAIDRAETLVCLEFYIVRADPLGQKLAEHLLAAVCRGVRVYLLYDYIGSFDTPRSFFRQLEQGGVTCVPFNPPSIKRGFTWLDSGITARLP